MRFFALLFLLIGLLIQPAFAQDKKESAYERVIRTGVLRCGYFTWPPYMSKDISTGAYSGLFYDLMQALGKTLNIKIEWTYEYSLGQQIEALKSGKMDALCGDGPWTTSAVPFVDYTHDLFFMPGYVYISAKNPKGLTMDKLNSPDVTFTQIDGDGAAEYIDLLVPKAKLLSMPATADPSLLIENVATGKADAMFNDPMSIYMQSQHNPGRLMQLNKDPVVVLPVNITLPKGNQDLLNMLNQGIDILNDTGRLARILKKHDTDGTKLMLPEKRYQKASP